ncbi:MAG: hypothetical protein AAGA30_21235, partial [Planctomycetota bacterium]
MESTTQNFQYVDVNDNLPATKRPDDDFRLQEVEAPSAHEVLYSDQGITKLPLPIEDREILEAKLR